MSKKALSNVFVLGTGRCGSLTFIRACEHLSNFTAGHETRAGVIGTERFNYPDNHIEADNRLAWFLGGLADSFSDDQTLYVHLRRDRDATAASFLKRWDSSYRSSIIRAFRHGIVMRDSDWDDPRAVCEAYVDTVTQNIDAFLRGRNATTIWLESAAERFTSFLERIGAIGDVGAAIGEWETPHNASLV